MLMSGRAAAVEGCPAVEVVATSMKRVVKLVVMLGLMMSLMMMSLMMS